jgi:hypothetical protein
MLRLFHFIIICVWHLMIKNAILVVTLVFLNHVGVPRINHKTTSKTIIYNRPIIAFIDICCAPTMHGHLTISLRQIIFSQYRLWVLEILLDNRILLDIKPHWLTSTRFSFLSKVGEGSSILCLNSPFALSCACSIPIRGIYRNILR